MQTRELCPNAPGNLRYRGHVRTARAAGATPLTTAVALLITALSTAAITARAAEPPPDLARKVVQRETATEAERAHYTYRQTVTVVELPERGQSGGEYHEVREVIFSPSGERTEQMVGRPTNTLRRLQMTPEDFADVRDIQPMMLTEDRMSLYQFTPKGEENIDNINCWVLQVRPRQILAGMRLFEGAVWVDQRDFSIIRSEGRAVPQIYSTRSQRENLFPAFTTVRTKVGSYWFPVLTEGVDTLPFRTGPVRMKLSIRYRNYKRFGAESAIRPGDPVPTPPATNENHPASSELPSPNTPPEHPPNHPGVTPPEMLRRR